MFEDIQKHRQAVQENIEKSFQIGFTESEDLQKAHNVGDVHPNGKWVWTQLPSGKFDWRVIKKTSQGTGNATPAGSKNDTQNQKTAPKSSVDNTKEDEKKKNGKERKAANLGEYYSSTLRGPKDVEEFFSDIRKKKISLDVLGMKRSDGTYDKVGRITGGKLGSKYDSYAVQVNIRWYGNSSNEKRQFASIADFKKFLVNVG